MAASNVLFVRSEEDNGEENDDPWDDTLLIRAYEAAFEGAKREIESGPSGEGKKPQVQGVPSYWLKGQYCRHKYGEGGKLYEARVMQILGDSCIIKYIGYENEETVLQKDLKESKGGGARMRQNAKARKEKRNSRKLSQRTLTTPEGSAKSEDCTMSYENEEGSLPHHTLRTDELQMPPPPPPPPLFHHNILAPNDSKEALNAMLMSWYMSGYHTGYYEGLKRAEKAASQ